MQLNMVIYIISTTLQKAEAPSLSTLVILKGPVSKIIKVGGTAHAKALG